MGKKISDWFLRSNPLVAIESRAPDTSSALEKLGLAIKTKEALPLSALDRLKAEQLKQKIKIAPPAPSTVIRK
jgi:hypothetical protein